MAEETQTKTHVWEFDLGCIGFSSRKGGGIFPSMVRTLTGSKWSHTFITFIPLWHTGGTVLEASMLVQTVPFDRNYALSPNEYFHLFKVNAPSEAKAASAERVFYEFAGDTYGYLQLLWFIWRWMNQKVGRDIRHSKNWFTDGVICSELVYWYLNYLGDPYKKLLDNYNPDTIQAQDLYEIALANPELFERVI